MPEKYHAIILLANLMDALGNPNEESRERADAAAAALRAGRAPVIVACGWAYRPDTDLPIALSLCRYLETAGVPATALVAETRSRDTVGDAVYTCLEGRYPRPLVVTSDYHAARTGEIFAFVHGRPVAVEPVPSGLGNTRREAELASLAAFRRTFEGIRPGDITAIHARMLARPPFYDGSRDPRLPP